MSYEELKAKYGKNWGIGGDTPEEARRKAGVEDLLQDFERAVRAAEKWWAEYKARQPSDNADRE